MRRIINDIVVLGRSCPDINKNQQVVICFAGYSLSEQSFIRLFPIPPRMGIKRWDVIQADVEQSPDRRFESWQLRDGYEFARWRVRKTGALGANQRLKFLESVKDGCVSTINESKRSLGIVLASTIRGEFRENREHYGMFQTQIYGDTDFMTRRDYPYRPYLVYSCTAPSCGGHEQQLSEWGAYEFMRKNPRNGNSLWSAMGIGRPENRHYLLVGNLFAHRSTFVVISDLRQKTVQMSLGLS